MALTQYLELTAGPAVVQGPAYKTPVATPTTAMRGTVPVAVPVLSNGVPANLPTGAVLFYGLKLPAAIKGAWLALAQLAAVDPVNSPGLWTGSLALNNPTLRAAQHADVDDPAPELDPLTCVAEIYYTLPPVNGVPTDPVGSIKFPFVVGAPLVDDSTDIAPAPSAPGDRPIDLFGVTQRTSATAGDPTALASVPTVGFTAGQLYSFTEASTGDLVFFRLTSGTATAGNANQVQPADYNAASNNVYFALVPTGASSVVSTPGIAYVASNGNDGTAAIGNPAKPFLTAQAAYTAAAEVATANNPIVLSLGVGSFGGINLVGSNWNPSVSIEGCGAQVSHLTGINAGGTPGSNDTADANGNMTAAATSGGNGGSIILDAARVDLGELAATGGSAGDNVNSTADPNVLYQATANGGNGGYIALKLDNTVTFSGYVNGGSAGNDTYDSNGGYGGYGGSAVVYGGICTGFGLAGGYAYAAGNEQGGAYGSGGSVYFDLCWISGSVSDQTDFGGSGYCTTSRCRISGNINVGNSNDNGGSADS